MNHVKHWLPAAVTHFLLAFGFALYQGSYPTIIYDAGLYLELASTGQAFREADELRTWAYPWFLAQVLSLAGLISLPNLLIVTVSQTAIYWTSSYFLVRSINSENDYLRIATLWMLSLNFYVAPYHSVTLTDSLYTSLTLLVIGVLLRLQDQHNSENQVVLLWAAASLGASFAIVVRPAALWLLLPVIVVFVTTSIQNPKRVPANLAALIFGYSLLGVQIWLNGRAFGHYSFLPHRNLGGSQLRWGVENYKYSTWAGESPGGLKYPSSVQSLKADQTGLDWYVSNPIEAMILLITKLAGGMDFDLVVPYPRELNPFSWLTGGLTLFVLVAGVVFLLRNLWKPSMELGARWFPLVVFLAWSAVTLPSAIELRFSLPMLSYLGFVAVVGFWSFQPNPKELFTRWMPLIVTLFITVLSLAQFVRLQAIFP